MKKLQILSVLLIITLCIAPIYGLFWIKERVVVMRIELEALKKEMIAEHDAVRMLKAEFSYLSAPKRLQSLSKEYLHLEAIENITINDDKKNAKQVAATEITSNRNIKWRYKRGHEKYLTQVSSREFFAQKTSRPRR